MSNQGPKYSLSFDHPDYDPNEDLQQSLGGPDEHNALLRTIKHAGGPEHMPS